MLKSPSVLILSAVLLLFCPPGAAAQSGGSQPSRVRVVLYDTVSNGSQMVNSRCRFTARVIDRVDSESDYPIDIITEGGNGECEYYKPAYTAWCHVGNVPDASVPTNFTAVAIAGGAVTLSWQDNSHNCSCTGLTCPAAPLPAWEAYEIDRSVPDGSFPLLVSVSGNASGFVDWSFDLLGVSPSQYPTYRLVACPLIGYKVGLDTAIVSGAASAALPRTGALLGQHVMSRYRP
jgi:hypothetical protein